MGILDDSEAHHIIPVEVLGRVGMLRELVKSGWNFNSKINGAPLAEGFHGNHPKYTEYVIRRMEAWVTASRGVVIGTGIPEFKEWIETVLLPELRGHIADAKRNFKATGQNLNNYFSRL